MNKEQAEAFAVPFPESVIRVKGGAFQARYVDHAHVTERLNEVAPGWTWQPMARDQNGLPLLHEGGLWMARSARRSTHGRLRRAGRDEEPSRQHEDRDQRRHQERGHAARRGAGPMERRRAGTGRGATDAEGRPRATVDAYSSRMPSGCWARYMTARPSSASTWASTGRPSCGPNSRPTVVLEVVA